MAVFGFTSGFMQTCICYSERYFRYWC